MADVFRAHADPEPFRQRIGPRGRRRHTARASQEARDGTAASGTEDGVAEGDERPEDLLAGLLGGQGG